jgi:hypothetical protein
VDLDALDVADDQERRVLEVLAAVEQLLVGGLEVGVLALVLPGEDAALPDVGGAVPSPALGDALLERVVVTGGIGLVRRGLAEHPTQVDEVRLRRRLLRCGHAAPLLDERGRCQGRVESIRASATELDRSASGLCTTARTAR